MTWTADGKVSKEIFLDKEKEKKCERMHLHAFMS